MPIHGIKVHSSVRLPVIISESFTPEMTTDDSFSIKYISGCAHRLCICWVWLDERCKGSNIIFSEAYFFPSEVNCHFSVGVAPILFVNLHRHSGLKVTVGKSAYRSIYRLHNSEQLLQTKCETASSCCFKSNLRLM